MWLYRRSFRNRLGRTLRRNSVRTGLGAGFGATLLTIVAAAARNERVRTRAREIGADLKRRLNRRDATLAT